MQRLAHGCFDPHQTDKKEGDTGGWGGKDQTHQTGVHFPCS